MRIGLVIYGALDTISGGYLYDRMLASHLRERGDQVEVISLPSGNYAGRLLHNLWFRLDRDFDVVLEDELCHPSLLALNASRRSAPFVSIVHNLSSIGTQLRPRPAQLQRLLEKAYLGSVDGFVFNSSTTCAAVLALGGANRPFVIAPPGGERLGESSIDAIEARASDRGPLRLLFLANVVTGKGLDIALAALKALAPADLELDVVGSSDVEPGYARRMQAQAASVGIPVRFHGSLDGGTLVHVLEGSHVLLLPSYYEGFGIALLEGMAHGIPAVATNVGAIPELVADGENGYLIPPGDSSALADRLSMLAADRRLVTRMGIAALRTYRSRPTWAQTSTVIRDFLLDIILRGKSIRTQGKPQARGHERTERPTRRVHPIVV